MSRGLGKWERYVIDALTYYDPDGEAFVTSYSISHLVNLYFNAKTGKSSPEQLGIFNVVSYHHMIPKQKSVYQAISRAVRSLEKKGVVTKRIVPDGCDPENDNKMVWEKWVDIIDLFDKRNKCIINKNHYLTKCLTEMRKVKTANRLFIRERCF